MNRLRRYLERGVSSGKLGAFVALYLIIVLVWVLIPLRLVYGADSTPFDEDLVLGLSEHPLLMVFGVLLAAPLLEELIFRGPLYLVARKWGSGWPLFIAALVSALIFCVLHFSGINTFGTGIIFSIVFLKGGALEGKFWRGISASIMVHMFSNIALAIIQVFFW